MNYRHIFHAGNFADVFKHIVLTRVIAYMQRKDAAFRVLDTHAGLGLYDLSSDQAQKTGEWKGGIGKVLAAADRTPADVRELITPYLDAVRSFEDRPWFTPDILSSIDAVLGWDDLRTSLRSRRWSEALRAVPRVGGSPVRLRATLRLLGERRHMRSRIGER